MTPPTQIHSPAVEQIGQLARNLHEALRELGYDRALSQVTQEIPDARDRLVYVGKLTEDATHKVLSSVESGLPECEKFQSQASELAKTLRRRADGGSSSSSSAVDRAMFAQCADYADRTAQFGQRQSEILTDIMMTQTFQDLSGQVIKKVVDIISRTEAQLLQILVDAQPVEMKAPTGATLDGPQVPDKAFKQDDVDDLLASLGF
jgi:chemotaxis protein CheZ